MSKNTVVANSEVARQNRPEGSEAVARATATATANQAVAHATDHDLVDGLQSLLIASNVSYLTAILTAGDNIAEIEHDLKSKVKLNQTGIIDKIRELFKPLCPDTCRDVIQTKWNDSEVLNKHARAYRKRCVIKAFNEQFEGKKLAFEYSQITGLYTVFIMVEDNADTKATEALVKALDACVSAGMDYELIQAMLNGYFDK